MAAGSANTAKFYWGATINAGALVGDLVGINDFTIDATQIDVSTIGANAYREFVGGKYQATFTVEVFWNQSAHGSLMSDLLARTSRNFELDFQNGQVTGAAIPTSAAITATQDDAVRATLSFQVTGALTIAATSSGP